MPLRIVIVGGGLSGNLLANGLLNHGGDKATVTIYERDNPSDNREGYQIRLGAPALIGMRACLSKEHKESICAKFGRSGGSAASAPIIYDHHFNKLLDLTKFPAYSKSAPINRIVLREALAEPLRKAGLIRYGMKYMDFEVEGDPSNNGKELVKVRFENGEIVECDILIAANGSGTPINAQVGLGNIKPVTGGCGFMSKCPITPETLPNLPKQIHDAPTFITSGAPENAFIFASAYLPEKEDSKDRNIDFEAASLMVGFNTERSRFPEDLEAIPDFKAYCASLIKHWDPRIRELVDAVPADAVSRIPMRISSEPQKDWRARAVKANPGDRKKGNGRVWLIGDAMHAMLPGRGMGANQAMNDTATCLPELLSLIRSSTNEDVLRACNRFEAEMIPRAFGWVKASGDGSVQDQHFPWWKVFLISRVLQLAGWYGWFRKQIGWIPEDDAPELRD